MHDSAPIQTPSGQTPSGQTTHAAPIRVKFTAKGHREKDCLSFLRQFPGRQPQWGNCQFTFDPEATDYDWLICYDDLAPAGQERFSTRVETLRCPRQHTMFITMEPSSIKIYGDDFLNQFGVVLTSQEPWAISTPNAVHWQPALRWFYGIGSQHVRDWDEIAAAPEPAKTDDLSTVCSSKRQAHTLHAKRFDFTHALQSQIPELRIFGHGTEPIDDKADAIDAFRYHLVIENHIADHHWTEKLADTFLGMALPIYVGCPNAESYFPEDSILRIDFSDVNHAAQQIRRAIANHEFERRLPAIREARRRVLEQYNLFAEITRLINAHHDAARPTGNHRSGSPETLYSRHAMRRRSLFTALRYAWEKTQKRPRLRRLVRDMKHARAA